VECIESGVDPLSPVTPETMRQAIALTEWFLNEAHRIYAMLAGNGEPADSEKEIILSIIRELGGEVVVRDVQRHMAKYSKKGGAESLERKLRAMVGDGILTTHHKTAKNGLEVAFFTLPIADGDIAIDTLPENAEKNGVNVYVPNNLRAQDTFSSPDVIEGFEDYQNPESAVAPDGKLADLAIMIRETFDREPGKNVVPFSEVLNYFDGDRVPASAFLNEYGFAVDDDGQVVNVA
jgi:hypothetical protein